MSSLSLCNLYDVKSLACNLLLTFSSTVGFAIHGIWLL